MYVYYESYQYRNNSNGFVSVSTYTHKVTVHQHANERLRELLTRKFGSKAVSKLTWDGRIYVRETLRIARHNKYLPTHRFFKRATFTDRATSRNFGLSIFSEIVSDDGLVEHRIERTDFIDE